MSIDPSALEDDIKPYRSLFETITPNVNGALFRYARTKPDILCLGQGEGTTPTPDFINKAAIDALADGKTFYTPVLGLPELREELSAYYQRIYGLDISTNRIFITPSGSASFHYALNAILDPNDTVVALTPIWKNLLGIIEYQGANIRQIGMEYDPEAKDWTVDLDKLFDACEGVKAIVIVSPSNPIGNFLSHEQIAEIMAFARARNIWIVADEVYGRLAYDHSRTPSFLDHAAPDDKLFVVNSFSKAWAMTGWRLGWLVGPVSAEQPIYDITLHQSLCLAPFIQIAGITALKEGEEFIKTQKQHWLSNRKLLTTWAEKHADRVDVCLPDAAFYAMVRVKGCNDCLHMGRKLIDEAGLSIAPGTGFGHSSRGWLRLCFAIDSGKLDQALKRFESIL